MSEEQAKFKAVVYDLGSENVKSLSETQLKRLVRSKRIRSVQLLHSLGLECTESVILVPSNNFSKIDTTIQKVEAIYRQLNETLRSNNIDIELQPIIKVLDITREQKEALIPLAKRRLIELLDNSIERVNGIISSLDEIEEEVRRRKILSNLLRLRSNWNRIFEIAQQLGIDISRDYQVLIDMIDSTIA
jgi:flagellin-specific chaperone FliS